MIAPIKAGGRVSPRQMREAINEVSEILAQLQGKGCRVVRNGTRWTIMIDSTLAPPESGGAAGYSESTVITGMRWNYEQNRIEIKTALALIKSETGWQSAIQFSEFDA